MKPRSGLPEIDRLAPRLIIFDKGGTLIDVHALWGEWVTELARRLQAGDALSKSETLFEPMGYDPDAERIQHDGWLATTTMEELRALTVGLVQELGASHQSAEATVHRVWFAPDPLAQARPLADLGRLFKGLRERGVRTAVATMDDRAPTEAAFSKFAVGDLVDALVCGDDDVRPKPAPDMAVLLCRTLHVRPDRAVIVGDGPADAQMGREAGVGLVVGVLTGVSPREVLAPLVDVVVESVAALA